MAFHCPDCKNLKTLQIINRIELPPDARSDEISLQIVKCNSCKFEAVAIYEESHRGALDQKEIKELKTLIRQCPEPKNLRCSCDTHTTLKRNDSFGRWVKPGFSKEQRTFRMIL